MAKKTKKIYMDTSEYDSLMGTIEDMFDTLKDQVKHNRKLQKALIRTLGEDAVGIYSINLATIDTDMAILKKVQKTMRYSARRGILIIDKDLFILLKDMIYRYADARNEEDEEEDAYMALARNVNDLSLMERLDI